MWNHNFEPFSSSHSNYILSESKLPKNVKINTCADIIFMTALLLIKLLVQVADVGVGHMHGGAILLSPNLLRLPPFQTLTWTWYWRRRTSTWYWRRRWYPRLFKLEELSKNHVWAMFFVCLFLGQFRLWMDIIWAARWNQLGILIPKYLWKSKIWLL